MNLRNVVVINLERRLDRLAAFTRRWAAVSDLDFQVFHAIDLPEDPAKGCLLSHQAVYAAYEGPLLILEDDAVFSPDFTLDLDAPADWDVLWLGGLHKVPPTPYDDTWETPTHLLRTHAYIVREPSRLAELAADIPRMDPQVSQLPLKQYSLKKFTVGQAAGDSNISRRVRLSDDFGGMRRRTLGTGLHVPVLDHGVSLIPELTTSSNGFRCSLTESGTLDFLMNGAWLDSVGIIKAPYVRMDWTFYPVGTGSIRFYPDWNLHPFNYGTIAPNVVDSPGSFQGWLDRAGGVALSYHITAHNSTPIEWTASLTITSLEDAPIGFASLLKAKMTDGTWAQIGTSARPFNVKMTDGTWLAFAGGAGKEMKAKMTDGTWRVVAKAGSGVGPPPPPPSITLSGVVSLDGYGPIPGVFVEDASSGAYVVTNSSGAYTLSGLNLGDTTITFNRSYDTPIVSRSFTVEATGNTLDVSMPIVHGIFHRGKLTYGDEHGNVIDVSLNWRTGSHSSYWDGDPPPRPDEPLSYGTGISYWYTTYVYSEEKRAWLGLGADGGVASWYTETDDQVAWVLIPMGAIRATVAYYLPPYAQFVSVDLVMSLRGQTVSVDSSSNIIGSPGGTGRISISPLVPTGSLTFTEYQSGISRTVAQLDSVAYARETTGQTLWSGGLNTLAIPTSSTPTIVTYPLTPTQSNKPYLVLHAHTSVVPSPPHEEQYKVNSNYLTMTYDLVFKYDY